MFGDRKFTMLWANFTDHDETHQFRSDNNDFDPVQGLQHNPGTQIPEIYTPCPLLTNFWPILGKFTTSHV
jgi:hypothetical protein